MSMMETGSEAPPATGAFQAALQQGLQASRGDDVGAALASWQQAAAIDPSSALPHFLIGAELAQAGLPNDAEDAYAQAVALAPGFDAARFQLGLLQFTRKRVALANLTWSPLFQGPGANPFHLFVKAFAALAREDLPEAAALFELGMAANTANGPLNRDMARVLMAIQSRAPRAAVPVSVADAETDGHVLLSAYRRQGLAH